MDVGKGFFSILFLDEDIATAFLLKTKSKRTVKRHWGVHPISQMRKKQGMFHNLVQEVQEDSLKFVSLFPVTSEQYMHILTKIEDSHQKQTTRLWSPIFPREKLAVCFWWILFPIFFYFFSILLQKPPILYCVVILDMHTSPFPFLGSGLHFFLKTAYFHGTCHEHANLFISHFWIRMTFFSNKNLNFSFIPNDYCKHQNTKKKCSDTIFLTLLLLLFFFKWIPHILIGSIAVWLMVESIRNYVGIILKVARIRDWGGWQKGVG